MIAKPAIRATFTDHLTKWWYGHAASSAAHTSAMPLPRADATELCCICARDTGVAVTMPVDKRVGYVIGVGQLCSKCS